MRFNIGYKYVTLCLSNARDVGDQCPCHVTCACDIGLTIIRKVFNFYKCYYPIEQLYQQQSKKFLCKHVLWSQQFIKIDKENADFCLEIGIWQQIGLKEFMQPKLPSPKVKFDSIYLKNVSLIRRI